MFRYRNLWTKLFLCLATAPPEFEDNVEKAKVKIFNELEIISLKEEKETPKQYKKTNFKYASELYSYTNKVREMQNYGNSMSYYRIFMFNLSKLEIWRSLIGNKFSTMKTREEFNIQLFRTIKHLNNKKQQQIKLMNELNEKNAIDLLKKSIGYTFFIIIFCLMVANQLNIEKSFYMQNNVNYEPVNEVFPLPFEINTNTDINFSPNINVFYFKKRTKFSSNTVR